MADRLYLVAGKVTDSVTQGFLPAAARLGLAVTVLTDRPADHVRACAATGASAPQEVVACEVTDFRAIIERIRRAPAAVFSNSDHLQAPAALAAAYFGLPGKDWRAATRAKNKALMRDHLAELDPVFTAPADEVPDDAPYPLVLKPREGVASEDVVLVADRAELAARRREITRPEPLIVEEYLPGHLHTLETLGDGHTTRVLGSFRTILSPPPYFAEQRLEWAPPPDGTDRVLALLSALGVGFGACHTEFVVSGGRARLIEVNYRIIGDHCDFLLADLLGVPVFEHVLRVHLGERLGDHRGAGGGHALVDYVFAERSGTLGAVPGAVEHAEDGVRLSYRPLRRPGEVITLTHTNRDYLGTIRAIGPDRERVEACVARFRSAHTWELHG
ncbi:ATP-grasp domain-containing protein [Actinomadura alba]|uniref:ATP-grasp domain-containing protein n=1 Tax=Actinomadura alba TaxID=406431 RepID=A0ABR7LX48_9ACTN|nr:ATP-grasp domain-containing protein [Actinomadura alba]MBC6469426.1 ATP-grasp domain-containing protein [Actinomadura alba]